MTDLFHPPTLFAVAVLLALVLGGALLWLWWIDRAQPALRSWAVAHLLAAVALGLSALRGVAPVWLSIDASNALLALCYGLTWHGARQFEGRRTRWLLTLAGAALWILACRIPGFHDRLDLRVALISGIVTAYAGAAAWEFLRGRRAAPLPSHLALFLLMAGHAAMHAARVPLALLLPFPAGGTALPAAPWYLLLLAQGVMHGACTAVLMVALVKERHEQRATAVLAAARDAAAAASAEKSRFLARMSHELRTPLNGVLGLAQALAQDSGLNSRQRDYAATMEQAGRHLLAIVNDVLDLARVEAGRLELSPRPLALRPVLEGALDLVRAAATAKGIVLGLHMAPDLPQAVLADPVRLRQILLNLLGNAVKFTPPRGRVTLLATRLGPQVGPQVGPQGGPQGGARDGLRLAVTDTGPGVPAALRERLFQDYARDPGSSTGSEGTGLGLAISAAMARAMGGRIAHAEGPGGIGSTFTAELPLPARALPEEPAPPPAPGAGAAPSRPLRVMVVDDVAANRMVAAVLLTQAGHAVVQAADGAMAVAMLAEAVRQGGLPDLVLMDLSMPGLDGFATTARIRDLPEPAASLPIVALTADALPEQVRECEAAGMDGHLAKPVERDALLATLARVADGRGAAPAQGA